VDDEHVPDSTRIMHRIEALAPGSLTPTDVMAPARTGTGLACRPYPTKPAVENAAVGRENYRSIEPVP
jgi:hypothetical protein